MRAAAALILCAALAPRAAAQTTPVDWLDRELRLLAGSGHVPTSPAGLAKLIFVETECKPRGDSWFFDLEDCSRWLMLTGIVRQWLAEHPTYVGSHEPSYFDDRWLNALGLEYWLKQKGPDVGAYRSHFLFDPSYRITPRRGDFPVGYVASASSS